MLIRNYPESIDYLVIGHLSLDITPEGKRLGGTAAYSALTAKALGLQVGIVTSWGYELPLDILEGIQIINYPTERSTTYENVPTSNGRIQYIYHRAPILRQNIIPETWLKTPIVHLCPIAQEVDPTIIRSFHNSFVGVTPQGWLREFNKDGMIRPGEWLESRFVLDHANAAVISNEDINCDNQRIEEFALSSKVLVVTEAADGAVVYWNGEVRRVQTQRVPEVDATGAGDIFATAFFYHYFHNKDPWGAAKFANRIATISVTRGGLSSVPTSEEVHAAPMEAI
ncbi:MAG: hypothetical protein J7L73_07075 [Anaerolineales bacterium]|nr:hypothetical protein [Anaerolineales bacterium]